MEKRYIVVDGSESWHCCFEATVLDTARPSGRNEAICECFEKADAERIAECLNLQP